MWLEIITLESSDSWRKNAAELSREPFTDSIYIIMEWHLAQLVLEIIRFNFVKFTQDMFDWCSAT